jgi:sugar lactone lactonase YvrE
MSEPEHVLGSQDEVGETPIWIPDEDRQTQPQAGDLFRIKTDVKGLVEPEFAG